MSAAHSHLDLQGSACGIRSNQYSCRINRARPYCWGCRCANEYCSDSSPATAHNRTHTAALQGRSRSMQRRVAQHSTPAAHDHPHKHTQPTRPTRTSPRPSHRPQALPAAHHRAAPGKPPAEQSSAASRRPEPRRGRGFAGPFKSDFTGDVWSLFRDHSLEGPLHSVGIPTHNI